MRLYTEGYVLADNEYLLKIREKDDWYGQDKFDVGFLTKLNQNGTVPVKFQKWGQTYERATRLLTEMPQIQIFTEEFKSGWKIVGARFGESQNWMQLLHPNNFVVEIYMTSFIELIKNNTIIDGELIGEFKWESNKLIKK